MASVRTACAPATRQPTRAASETADESRERDGTTETDSVTEWRNTALCKVGFL